VPSKQLGWIVVATLLGCACGGDDTSAPSGGAGGGGAGGAGGAGGTGGTMSDPMDSGANAMSGSGGSGGDTPIGGMGGDGGDSDAMVALDASDASEPVDTGAPAPFQIIAWPSDDAVVAVDAMNTFGTDVSGITVDGAFLWLSMNLAPSKLYKMEKSGATWQRVATDSWDNGKTLLFPDGAGVPDAEGVTKAELDSAIIYIGSERNLQGGNAATSRPGVLSYDTSAAGASLTAVREWNLTESLPAVGANQGVEAMTWIPDSALDGFYDPVAHPLHGTGLFVVGLESKSDLYFFALNSDGSSALIATVATELAGVMGLEYDRSAGYLWAYCDDTCGNRAEILSFASGEWVRRAEVMPPASLPDINNEGIAIAPDSECAGDRKPFYWVEDGNTDGHVLRAGTIPCGAFLDTP
jgi:hypothetical protein